MVKRLLAIKIVLLLVVLGSNSVYAQQKLPKVLLPVFRKDTFSIVKYGAVADGVTLNTSSIKKAIEACHAKGGGVVLIPTGMWLTGPVVLRSNVNLHLQKNAILQFTEDFNQYPLVEGNWEGLPQMRNQSPISAEGANNIAITGHGIIDGAGDAWRMVKKEKLTESNWKKLLASGGVLSDDKKTWYPTENALKASKLKNPGAISPEKTPAFYNEVKDFLRANLLVLTKCSKILLEGVTFQNSPAWCLHPLMSEHITVRNVQVKNPWYAQNGDGIDLESCRYVLIENSTFDVGDDGICIKSGRDAEGRKRGMPTQDVIIRNCTVYHAHGGFVIGSEMSGGAKNIYVSDCTFMGTDIGLRFKTTRGRGGVVENIYINNITMRDIVGEAILFDMYYAAQDPIALTGEKREPPKVEELPVSEATPQFRNIFINNVVANGAEKAIFVRGLPEMNVKNIVLQNMVLQAKHGLDMTEGSDITLRNVQLITSQTDPVLYVHNSKNITLDNIKYLQAETLLSISGEKSGNIRLHNTDASKAKQKIRFEFGATEKSLADKSKTQ
ncbi:MAG TPA: glycoside hydrolase family 28 protein [Chitinophagaceae bacterium]